MSHSGLFSLNFLTPDQAKQQAEKARQERKLQKETTGHFWKNPATISFETQDTRLESSSARYSKLTEFTALTARLQFLKTQKNWSRLSSEQRKAKIEEIKRTQIAQNLAQNFPLQSRNSEISQLQTELCKLIIGSPLFSLIMSTNGSILNMCQNYGIDPTIPLQEEIAQKYPDLSKTQMEEMQRENYTIPFSDEAFPENYRY